MGRVSPQHTSSSCLSWVLTVCWAVSCDSVPLAAADSTAAPHALSHVENLFIRHGTKSECFSHPFDPILTASAEVLTVGSEERKRLWQGAAAGAIAGAATELILHPVDTIKTRAQLSGGMKGLKFDMMTVRTLYSGTLAGLAGAVPSCALFYMVYDAVCRRAKEHLNGDQMWVGHLAGGTVAAVVSSVLRVPSEVIKTQIQSGHAFGNRKTISNILGSARGWKGLYVGHSAFLLRDVPFDAAEFVLYEQMQGLYRQIRPSGRFLSGLEDSVIGAVAGGIAGAITTPFDVIKARLMVRGALGEQSRPSLRQAVSTIIESEGVKGLFRGVGPRVVWLASGGCIFFPVLEASKHLMQMN